MGQILVKYRTKINWISHNDWVYVRNGDWVFNITAEYNGSGNFINILSKELPLKIGTKYRIKFELAKTNAGELIDGIYLVNGPQISGSLTTEGTQEYIITAASPNLEITPLNSNSKFALKNLTIEELGYDELDAFDVEILYSKSISDIKELYERSGAYSSEITLPGTDKNNKFFKNVFDITTDNFFNINAKVPAALANDNIILDEGYIQLLQIINKRDEINYKIIFYSNVVDLFADIGDKYLNELPLSSLDNTASLFNVMNSWDNNNPLNYYYGYINFGGERCRDLWGGIVGSGINDTGKGLTIADIYPGVRVKALIDIIFNSNGLSYESTLIESDNFNKLVIPFTNNVELLSGWHKIAQNYNGNIFRSIDKANPLGPPQYYYDNRTWHSDYSTGAFFLQPILILNGTGSGIFGNNNKIYDYYGFFNVGATSWNDYTVVSNSPYTITPNSPQSMVSLPGCYRAFRDGKYKIESTFGITDHTHITGNEHNYLYRIYAFKIPVASITYYSGYFSHNYFSIEHANQDEEILMGEWRFGSGYHSCEAEFNCLAGDIIGFKIIAKECQHILQDNDTPLFYDTTIQRFNVYEYKYGRGSSVLGKNLVPQKMKIKEFLKDIILMFNLYIEQDKDDQYHYIIETRDTFYSGGTTYDWTDKIDLTEKTLETPKDYQNRKLKLKYSADDDFWNKYYIKNNDPNNVNYGGKQYEFENEFVEDNYDIELNFASTPLRTYFRNTVTGYTYVNLSEIVDADVNTLPEELVTEWKPRILISNAINTNLYNPTTYNNFRFEGYNLSVWPYIGHLYNPMEMDGSNVDINFETPLITKGVSQLMFKTLPANSITNTNLFNLYWEKYLNSINHKDARILIARFNLNINDVKNLSFRDKILIENVYYTINSIREFDIDAFTLTEVELVKIIDVEVLSKALYSTNSIIQQPINVNVNNLVNGVGNQQSLNGGSIILGDQNLVTSTKSSILIGNNNIAPGGSIVIGDNVVSSSKIVALNSSNVSVEGDLKNVIVIGSDNTRITEDDAVFIGGVKIKNGEITTNDDAVIDPGNDIVQVEFSESIINDPGENKIWDYNYVDANVLVDPA